MKTNDKNLKYWSAKGFISFFMLFSAFYSYTHAQDLQRLGFPDYFRIELVIGKVTGAILLLIPATPPRIREWIYAAFGISMVSAIIAHICSDDPIGQVIFVCVDLVLISTCVWYVSSRETSISKKIA